MFTGIIEALGRVEEITEKGTNKTFTISSPISHELKIDQSIAHSGVCLTVESLTEKTHTLTAILETLEKTNLHHLKVGDHVNLERCMKMNGRLDGHIVQGHVDDVGTCISIEDNNGSWSYTFQFDSRHQGLLINKGSITINGTSLTVVHCDDSTFSVAIIPYTQENTIFKYMKVGDTVNLEFDILGKYILKNLGKMTAS